MQRNKERIPIAPISQLPAILNDAVDLEGRLQIDLHAGRAGSPEHLIGDAIPTRDARIGRVHAHVQVVKLCVPPSAPWSIRATQCIGMRVARRVLDREDEEQCDHSCANTRSPLNFLARESQGKKITTRNSTVSPVGAYESHFPLWVPVTLASSQTP